MSWLHLKIRSGFLFLEMKYLILLISIFLVTSCEVRESILISNDPNSGTLVLRLIDNSENKEWSNLKIHTLCFQETGNEDPLENECLGEELISRTNIGVNDQLTIRIKPGKYTGRILVREETFFFGNTVVSVGLFGEKLSSQANCEHLSGNLNGAISDISRCPGILIKPGKRTMIDFFVTNEKESFPLRAFWLGLFSKGLSGGSRQFSINHSKFHIYSE